MAMVVFNNGVGGVRLLILFLQNRLFCKNEVFCFQEYSEYMEGSLLGLEFLEDIQSHVLHVIYK